VLRGLVVLNSCMEEKISGLITIRQEAAPEALDDTCNSKVCTESAINSYKKIDTFERCPS